MPAFALIFLPSAIAASLLKPALALAFYVAICIAVIGDLLFNFKGISYPSRFDAGIAAVPAATYAVMVVTGIYVLVQCFKMESEY